MEDASAPRRGGSATACCGGWRWPVALSTSTVTLLTLVNLFWIGHLGTIAVAAVSVCGNILFIVFGLSNIVHTGALAIVSRRVGERQSGRGIPGDAPRRAARRRARRLVVAAAGYVSGAGGGRLLRRRRRGRGDGHLLSAHHVRRADAALRSASRSSACYQAGGDTRTPMLINVGVVLANGVADPFFIFEPGQVSVAGLPLGWLGWGVDGAAIAAVLTSVCRLRRLPHLVGRSRQRPFPPPATRVPPLVPAELWHMLRIGTPASIAHGGAAAVDLPAAQGHRVVRHHGDRRLRHRHALVRHQLDSVFRHLRRRRPPGRPEPRRAPRPRGGARRAPRPGGHHRARRALLRAVLRRGARHHARASTTTRRWSRPGNRSSS